MCGEKSLVVLTTKRWHICKSLIFELMNFMDANILGATF
jgi:hypothetical protein